MSIEKHTLNNVDDVSVPLGWTVTHTDPVIILHPRVLLAVLEHAGAYDAISCLDNEQKSAFKDALDDADAASVIADLWIWINRTSIVLVAIYILLGMLVYLFGYGYFGFSIGIVCTTIIIGVMSALSIDPSTQIRDRKVQHAAALASAGKENGVEGQ